MLTTPELIIALERRGFLPPADVARVRQLYENSPTEFVPRVMFKWLVSRNRLTTEQAEKLLKVDAKLSAAEAIDSILGLNDNLQLAPDDDASYDEDTKDMPREAADDLTLAPPGGAPFADSPATSRGSLIPPKQPAPPQIVPPPIPAAPRPAAAELLDELFAGAGAGTSDPLARTPSLRVAGKRNKWDSPLMLVGGGALLLLLGVGSFLTWRILREGGDKAFQSAEEAYRNGGYGTAVERYDKFLEDYPSHRSAGTAVVHRGLARLRQAVEAGGDWSTTLATAKTILPEIAALPEFAASRADLSALLPDIAENLAKQAATPTGAAGAASAQSIAEAREARKLIDKYAAASDAIAPRLQQIDALLAAAERRLLRQTRLQAAVAAIRAAAADRNLEEAARTRSALLLEFPDAAGEPELIEALTALAETKRQTVRYASVDAAAETAEPPTPIVRKVTLSDRRGDAAAGAASDDVYAATIEGSLFAFNAADGTIRWTRPVGFDAGSPAVVADSAGRDVVLFDGTARALVRVAAADGTLRWRQPRASSPTFLVQRDRIYVTRNEEVVVVDLASGRVIGEVAFPTDLAGPPVSDPRERVRYQLGLADDLYVVSNNDFRCLQAYFVGHAAGSIAVPPTCVGPYILLVENVGEQSQLRLLESGADGASLTEVGRRMLDGRVTLPPQVSARLVAVVSNGGPVELLDLSGAADRKPLESVARLTAASDRIVRRHFVFRDPHLWLGGKGLARYEFQPNLGKLTPIRTVLENRTTLQAPQLVGDAVVCRAQPSDFSRPAAVTAIDAERGATVWETSQIAPLVGPPQRAADQKSLSCVTSDGAVYDVTDATAPSLGKPATTMGAGVVPLDDFGAATKSIGAVSAVLPGGEQVFVVRDESKSNDETTAKHSLLVLEQVGAEKRTTRTPLVGRFTAPPTAFRDGVVIPADDGQFHFLDPRTGAPKTEPFQPPQVAGRAIDWSQAHVLGDDVLACDGTRLYRLQVEDKPQPFLKSQASVDLARPAEIVGAVGRTVYLADAAGELTAYSLPDLRPGESWKIRGARAWRAAVVGERLVVAASADRIAAGGETLLGLEGDGTLAWQTSHAEGSKSSHYFTPVADGADFLAADDHGDVVRFDGATGKEKARTVVRVPLAAAPVVVGERVVLTTQAGELLWIAKP